MTSGGECLCEDYGVPENSTLVRFMWFLRKYLFEENVL